MSGRGVWAVVPVKCFARGKSRLDGVLTDPAREELARSLCAHVLATLGECEEIEGVLVATDCPLVERFAEGEGALVVRDVAVAPLAQVIDRALAVVAARGAGAAVVLMADLPLLAADDVRALVSALDRTPLVVAPDRGGHGTNALALAPPDRIATCFGSEISFDRHVARAEAGAIAFSVLHADGIAFDLDLPADAELVLAEGYAERGALLSWNRKRPSRVRAA